MGAYPSADLLYGIDLGPDKDRERPGWFTEELEEEHGSETDVLDRLLRGVKGVGHLRYGDSYSGYRSLALCTQSVGASAYTPEPVDPNLFASTAGDDEILRAAWAVLYPGQLMPEPGWFMVVSYG